MAKDNLIRVRIKGTTPRNGEIKRFKPMDEVPIPGTPIENGLCYGDSNTWGYISGSNHLRYGKDERWTRLLAQKLGDRFEIIEEGLNSRTLISHDTRPGKEGKNENCFFKTIDFVRNE